MSNLNQRLSEARKLQMLRALLDAVVDTVAEAGPQGAPGGILYTALMQHGISFESYTAIMSTLVKQGRLRHSNHCYHVVSPK